MLWLGLLACTNGNLSLPMGTDVADAERVDDCVDGETMSDPVLVRREGSAWGLVLEWATGSGRAATLPPAYFEQVRLGESSDPLVLEAVYSLNVDADAEGGELSISIGRPMPWSSMVLEFPDRRMFIQCSHPGDDHVWWVRADFRTEGWFSASVTQGVDVGGDERF